MSRVAPARSVKAAGVQFEGESGEATPERLFGSDEKRLVAILVACVVIALLFPFKPVKFALAAALGLVYLNQLSRRPDLALAVYVIALPVVDLLPPNLIPIRGINPQTILVVLLLLRAMRERGGDGRTSAFTPGFAIFTSAIMVGVFHTVLAHGYPLSDLLQDAKSTLIVIPVLYVAARVLRTPKQKTLVLASMGLLLFFASMHTIWETRDQIAAGRLLETNRPGGLVGGQPNLYGGWLAMMLAAAICFFFSTVLRGKARLLLGGIIGLGSITILYTLSRGAWVALLVTLTVVAVFRNRRILLLGTMLIFLLPTLVSPAMRERAASILTVIDTVEDEPSGGQEADASAMVRVIQWREFGTLFWQSPLVGSGYGYFPQLWANAGHEMKAAHSSIIEIGSELGILGLLGYACLVFPMVLLGWSTSRSDMPLLQRTVGTAAFSMGFCLLLLDTSGTRFRNPEVMSTFWVLAGIMASPWHSDSRSTSVPRQQHLRLGRGSRKEAI